MRLPLRTLLLVVLSAVLAFGAPVAGSFASEQPCMATMPGDGGAATDCGCTVPAMSACAFSCGFAPAGLSMAVPSIASGNASLDNGPISGPPQHYQSVSSSPGFQPPR
jgi:hypothetical protein